MTPLVSRLFISVVGLPIVLALVWGGGWWLFSLLVLAALIGLHEYYLLIRSLHPLVLAGYVGMALTLVGAQVGGLPWAVAGLYATIPLAFAQYGISTTRQPATIAVGSTLLGVVWIGGGLATFELIRAIPDGGHHLGQLAAFTVLLAVFAADTAAYAMGRLVGRHKLSPVLSPGKTWEGFFAGVVAAIAVAFFALYSDRDVFLAIWQALLLGVIIVAAEALGDLFESSLKRDMHVKDTGRLLGGHGGILDRIDSLLFAGSAAFFTLVAFGVV
ncbi:MAG TPA: phosphatidate cytidylyltransferase [Gaiellaceae bacterium]